jgi:acetyltransferase-like isoleucine patch superfamily enzyme
VADGPEFIGTPGYIASGVVWRGHVTLGHASTIGYPTSREGVGPTRIGDSVTIGAFCIVEQGADLADGVCLDHYCRVGSGSTIGCRTKLLYGVQVFEDCAIGARCIIGGHVDDRVVIEDDVTYMGSMAHSYREPGSLETWDQLKQPSPVIRRGAVVGQGALIIGGVEIGEGSYIAAGEIVRHDIPRENVLYRGQISPIEQWRGVIKARSSSE